MPHRVPSAPPLALVPAVLASFVLATGCSSAPAPCVPDCRAGFVCVAGACVSACNPPCGAGLVCTASATCERAPDADAGPDDAGTIDGGAPDDDAGSGDDAGPGDDAGAGDAGGGGSDAAAATDAGGCGAGTVPGDGGCVPYRTSPYGSWRPIAMSPLPFTSALHAWTGSRVLVVPRIGLDTIGRVFLYDPAADAWETVGATGFPAARRWASFAWTGSAVAIWGGYDATTFRSVADGALYDPATGAWTPMTLTAAPSPRIHAGMAWAGDRLVVFGGDDGSGALATGAQYDPVARLWTPLPTAGAPIAGEGPVMVWTGRRLIVWGSCEDLDGGTPRRCTSTGALYDPATETWSPMATAPIAGRGAAAVAWTGREMIVWGGANFDGGWSYFADGARYDAEADAWTLLPAVAAPARRDVAGAWTGLEMIPWGGWEGMLRDVVGRWDATTDAWVTMSVDGAPGARDMHAMVWTGRELVVTGGRQLGTGYYERQDGAAWTP